MQSGQFVHSGFATSYGHPVTIVSSADSRRVCGEPTLGWKDLISGTIGTIELSGDHDTIVKEPLVHELAAKIAECLDDNTDS